mmetsp:Transcript_11974/g.22223  ORF Transcript_11974/g.22223 Transcript_11974/m.22223 type:complete len:83 (-) Transcript_11974:1714-1962(-)
MDIPFFVVHQQHLAATRHWPESLLSEKGRKDDTPCSTAMATKETVANYDGDGRCNAVCVGPSSMNGSCGELSISIQLELVMI